MADRDDQARRASARLPDQLEEPAEVIDSDVIVVGGGPAGSSCAWSLKRKGINAIVLDQKTFPGRKACAGWITPKVFKDLELKIGDYPHSLLRFKKLHYIFGKRTITVPTRQYSIQRSEFDPWLLERADVPVHRHSVKNIRKENGSYIIDDMFRCSYLVGAGGTHCPVYRTFFREAHPRAEEFRIIAMVEEFPYDCQDRNCYLWFYEKDLPGYAWYVPKGGGYLNVGIGGKWAVLKERKETIREHWSHFIKKLERLSLVNNRSFNPRGHNYYLRQSGSVCQLGRAFIAGDAAGLATLDMGEGIGPAVESGVRAARAIAGGRPYSIKSIAKYSFASILFPWWNGR
jgi:menaquinone-9 beta-reductase